MHCRFESSQRTEDPPWSLGDVQGRAVSTFVYISSLWYVISSIWLVVLLRFGHAPLDRIREGAKGAYDSSGPAETPR